MGGPRLHDLTWPEVAERASTLLLAVPLGSTEQHGPHLPLTTDTDLAVALADRLASARDDVVVAPAVAYGASGEHAGFPGTLSIGGPALELVVVELLRSADAFRGVVLVSGHGGNRDAVAAAASTATSEGRRVLVWTPLVAGGDAHAGDTETSLMLQVRGDAVRTERAEAGVTTDLATLLPELRARGVAAVSENGVLGDPTTASAARGAALLDALARDLLERVAAWAP